MNLLNRIKYLLHILTIISGLMFTSHIFADSEKAQALQTNDPKSDKSQCQIIENKKKIILKCGQNSITVTPEMISISTPNAGKQWSN